MRLFAPKAQDQEPGTHDHSKAPAGQLEFLDHPLGIFQILAVHFDPGRLCVHDESNGMLRNHLAAEAAETTYIMQ